MQVLFDKYSANILSDAMLQPLVEELGVSIETIKELGVGYNPSNGAYITPERNNQGKIIGLVQRLPDGKKIMIKGSKRGLTYVVKQAGQKYTHGAHNWTRVSKKLPCPVCGKPDGCLIASENPSNPAAVVCVHISEGSTRPLKLGYLHILKPGADVTSGQQGLLEESPLPVIVAEGYSDTAAAMDMGFVAVGRPSAQAKVPGFSDLLRGRDVIIVGDNDAGAGKQGMEATFITLEPTCNSEIKVMPPVQFKDLRQWKNQTGLSKELFLSYVESNGDKGGDPNVLDDDSPSTIAKTWLDKEKTQDGIPTIRCYRGQWVDYNNGCFANYDKEGFRGNIYRFLEGKVYPKTGSNGELTLVPYRSTRAKVSDVIDALSQWCPVGIDPPCWVKDMGLPAPHNLIPFQNGILDVNEYIQGHVKLYPATPALFSFNVLPYDFDEDLDSKLWGDFVGDIFNGEIEKIRLLAQWFGYNCVPDMSFEKLMLCTGRPRSGKGTVLNTLAATLGRGQCVSTSFQALCSEFGYQPLIGKLAALLSDAKVPRQKQAKSALEKILQIVGGDPIGVQRKYLSYLPQVQPTCRFTIAMNELPGITDQINALESKLLILEFQNSYEGREDFSLKKHLCDEARAGKLINFALRGLKQLRQDKLFVTPPSSHILIKQLREITSPITAFIKDCCELEPPGLNPKDRYHIIIDQLYDAWVEWCRQTGLEAASKPRFGKWFLNACPSAVPARLRTDDQFTGPARRHRVYQRVRLADWVYKEYLGVTRND